MNVPSVEQAAVLQRFVAVCEQDHRIVAAFLGGSFASGQADTFSDLDMYLVTAHEAYGEFFAQRVAFMRHLGEPVFLEDFNTFGFDMLIFTFADGIEGELALAPDDNFAHIHGGPYQVLVDKTGVLSGIEFPLLVPAEAQQHETLRHTIYWFWEDVSHFTTAMFRKRWWLAYSSIEETRRKVVNLAHLHHDFTKEPSGYGRVEQDVPHEHLLQLQTTFCPLEPAAMVRAIETITKVYQQFAPAIAAEHGIEYPSGLDRVMCKRLERLHIMHP
jgi:predicted nucleotidyltransferase